LFDNLNDADAHPAEMARLSADSPFGILSAIPRGSLDKELHTLVVLVRWLKKLDAAPLTLPGHLPALEWLIRTREATLVVIDPLAAVRKHRAQ